MVNDHFADVSKKDTMSLNHALIILDRLNTTERIDGGEWYDVGEYVFADTIRNADTIIEAEVSK